MLTKKNQEQNPTVIQFEDLYSAANDLQTLASSGELMSCGGMYFPAEYESLPLKNTTQILTLPTYHPRSLMLKNWSLYENLNMPAAMAESEEEKVEIGSSITVRKYLRDWPQ